ncbi:MerR family DNA-binding transcriptional regulator [Chloroflexota bacterium]
MERASTVSEVARRLGCSERWLRDAETKGRIPKARRNLNGWRIYTEGDIEGLASLLIPPREEDAK